jgi:uncharacterized membrane protein
MPFCPKCGAKTEEGAKFCPGCGAQLGNQQNQKKNEDFSAAFNKATETQDRTSQFDQADIANNKGISVLSYIGILALIPYFAKKESPYAQFHAKQGMNLFVVEVAFSIVSWLLNLIKVTKYTEYFSYRVTPWPISLVLGIAGAAITVIAIIGIINACSGKAKTLPLVSKIDLFK